MGILPLSNRQAYRGMTLIEFLIIIGIMAITAVASVSSFTSIVRNYRISGVAEQLYYQLQYARSEAVKRNATVYVSFSTGDSWCYGINVGGTCDCTTAGSCGLATTSASAPGLISLSTSGMTGNSINFEGTHGAANASGSVTLTLFGQTSLITLSISRFGNLQLCSTGISGYTAC